jgi:hypothetical protein
MSLESVGVLKLQANSSRGQTPCSKTPTAVPSAFGGQERPKHWSLWYRVLNRAERLGECASLDMRGTVMLGAAPQLPSSCTSTPAAEALTRHKRP